MTLKIAEFSILRSFQGQGFPHHNSRPRSYSLQYNRWRCRGAAVSFLVSIAMVGSSSVVYCAVCGGVVLAASKYKANKLSLRKSQQGNAKLCHCSQPSGSSSSSAKVRRASPKASTGAKILSDVLVKPAYENISDDEADFLPKRSVSQNKNKLLRNLLTKPRGQKRKSGDKFSLAKHAEQFANRPGTLQQTEEVQIKVGNVSKFNDSRDYMVMQTQEFEKALQIGTQTKFRKLNSESRVCSQTGKKSDFGNVNSGKEVVGYDAASKYAALVGEMGIGDASGSEGPTSRRSQLHTPPTLAPVTNMPPLDDVPVASPAVGQASPISGGAPVALSPPTLVPAISTAPGIGAIKDVADGMLTTPVVEISSATSRTCGSQAVADEILVIPVSPAMPQMRLVPGGKGVRISQGPTSPAASSAASREEAVETTISSTQLSEDDEHDDDDGGDDGGNDPASQKVDLTSLTQNRIDEVDRELGQVEARLARAEAWLVRVRARTAEIEQLKLEKANLLTTAKNIQADMVEAFIKISSLYERVGQGHSSVIAQHNECSRQLGDLNNRKIAVMEEINNKAQQIWQRTKDVRDLA